MRFLAFTLLAATSLGCGHTLDRSPLAGGAGRRLVLPREDEIACTAGEAGPDPPLELVERSDDSPCDPEEAPWCFRLVRELRDVAAARDPNLALARSAAAYEAFLRTRRPLDQRRGDAFADLAVSGGAAHAALRAGPLPRPSRHGEALALQRALRVAWALRGPIGHRAEARPSLGWIAVSPEDDPPDRPVGASVTPFSQADARIRVVTGGRARDVRARVVVASTSRVAGEAAVDHRSLPPPEVLELPSSGPILLYLHGHSSLAEEATALTEALLAEARAHGEELTVVLPDLPSSGYSERVDVEDVLRVDPSDEALLRFHDAYVEGLVEALDRRSPGARGRIAAVMGGSLGGNLALRVAERARERGWPKRAIVWSPASIDVSWSRARFPFAGPGQYVDLVKQEAVRITREASREPERPDSRERYFAGGLPSVESQSRFWYRPGWDCGGRLVRSGLLQRGEVYDSRFRRWHYRVAFEQLVASHFDPGPDGVRPYERVRIPVLLAAGDHDDAVPMRTWSFVLRLAPLLPARRTSLFRDTGHAIHSERPRALASEIASFVFEVRRTSSPV